MSKVLDNRLKRALPTLVRDYQSGFITGRQILDGIAVAQEITQLCHNKKLNTILLKLDFKKAYDLVE